MPAFVVEVDASETSSEALMRFVSGRNQHMKECRSLAKNPFPDGKILVFGSGERKALLLCDMPIIWPSIWWLGFYVLLVGFGVSLTMGWPWLGWLSSIAASVLFLSGVVRLPQLFVLVMRFGLRKAGYSGSVRLLRPGRALRELVRVWDSEK